MINNSIYSSVNPRVSGGVADRDSTYSLGRKAFINNVNKSYESQKLKQNLYYSKNALANKQEHGALGYTNMQSFNPGFSKPLPNQSHDLRIQRLRMMTIGEGTMRIDKKVNSVNFNNVDNNFVNTALTRTRAGGSIAPRKKGARLIK
jgi:hypothetical protein